MSPQLQVAMAAIQPLSTTDRQQLLALLNQNDATLASLNRLSQQFWQGQSIQQLRDQQQPITVEARSDLKADFWPEEESIADFLNFLRRSRQDAVS